MRPFKVLDATLFYEDWTVSTLMRQLCRMGYSEKEAKKIFRTWLAKRCYKIIDVATVTSEGGVG